MQDIIITDRVRAITAFTSPYPLPVCSVNVVKATEWRERCRLPLHCTHKAKYLVAGKVMCKKHASMEALKILINGGVATRKV